MDYSCRVCGSGIDVSGHFGRPPSFCSDEHRADHRRAYHRKAAARQRAEAAAYRRGLALAA